MCRVKLKPLSESSRRVLGEGCEEGWGRVVEMGRARRGGWSKVGEGVLRD